MLVIVIYTVLVLYLERGGISKLSFFFIPFDKIYYLIDSAMYLRT